MRVQRAMRVSRGDILEMAKAGQNHRVLLLVFGVRSMWESCCGQEKVLYFLRMRRTAAAARQTPTGATPNRVSTPLPLKRAQQRRIVRLLSHSVRIKNQA